MTNKVKTDVEYGKSQSAARRVARRVLPHAKASRRSQPPTAIATTDPLNQEIIRLLQDDGRMSFSDVASRLDISEGTARNRINAMKESGQIRIVAITDPRAVAYHTDAMLGLKIACDAKPSDVAERLGRSPEVVYILWLSGRYDLLVEVVTEDHDSFLDFLEREVHGQPDISSAETMQGLKNFKNQFMLKRNWG